MAALSLVFDLIGRDISASKAFTDVGNAADRAGKKGEESGGLISKGMKLAGGALLGAGLIEGFKSLYDQAAESAKIGRLTTQVLQSTGGAAGVTAKQVSDLATAISNKTGVDDEAIQSGENLLLTFTGVRNEVGKGNDIFNRATGIITDMSVALGQDMSSSAIQVGKALNDPIKGVSALQRVGVSFTESQKDQIKTLVATGNTMEAQKLILGELTKEFGGAAAAASTPFQKLQVQLGNLAEQVGSYLIPVVDDLSKFFADHILPNTSKLATFIGGALNPALHLTGGLLGTIADIGGGAVTVFASMPGPIQAVAAAIGLLAVARIAGIFTTLASFGETLALKFLYMRDAMSQAGSVMGSVKAAGQGLVGFLGGPFGLAVIAAAAGLPMLINGIKQLVGASDEGKRAQESFADALKQTGGVVDANARKAAQNAIAQAGLVGTFKAAGVSAQDAISGILGNSEAQDRVNKALQEYITHAPDGQGAHSKLATAAADARDKYAQLGEALGMSKQEAQYFATAAAATGKAAADTVPQVDEAKKALEQWLKQLQQIGEGFVQPLSIYQDLLSQKQQKEQESAQATADATASSKDSWKDYVKNVSVSLDDYAKKLEEQITNQDNWRVNIGKIAQRGGLEVAQILANMGVQGADLTAQMATATDANFQRMAQDLIRDAQNGGAGAAQALDQQMKIMAEIGKEGGAATAQAVSNALGIGINDVAATAARYGITLATGLEPILRGLGKPPIVVPGFVTRPGLIGRNADGGFIKGPGTGRSDSIFSFLSNGEFVVNAAATARHRDMLEAINSAPRFATGGFVTPDSVPRPYSTAPYGALVASPSDGTMSLEYNDVASWLKTNLFSAIGGPGGGAEQWRGLVLQVLGILGQPGSLVNGVLQLIAHESGGNPRAINLSDSNFRAGHPSQGLMQTIPGTFYGYAGPYAGLGITNPLANIYAGLNYGIHRYGSIANIPGIASLAHGGGYKPYDSGGMLEPGYTLAYNGTGKAERVRTAEQEAALSSGHTTVVGVQNLGPVTYSDTERVAATSFRHAAMAAARFQ